ncbi:hypothetical protein [Laspinema palackyanum]|uniref:hypothetical protein n=1 Tax=Laspinema palackyanum TaxID=3231601 RepID=UPI00349FBFB5
MTLIRIYSDANPRQVVFSTPTWPGFHKAAFASIVLLAAVGIRASRFSTPFTL